MRLSVILSALAAGIGISSATAAEPDELAYVPNSTKTVCQLTGDFDRAAGIPTLSQTGKRFGVVATDLGSSFEHKGKLYFLFGDTRGRPGDRDVMAWTTSTRPDKIILDFHKGKDDMWLPLTVPGIKQGAFEIPSGGISIAGTMYVVCTTDHSEKKVMGRSVLASSHDDGQTFKMLYELSRDKFINVSFWLSNDWLYIYGSGEYRKSSVCLARVKPADIGDRSKVRYFAGAGVDGQPKWLPREADAVVLFRHDEIGEFSLAYLQPVKRYVMLYNAGKPRGITMRSAEQPGALGRTARSYSSRGATTATDTSCTSPPNSKTRKTRSAIRSGKKNGAESTAPTSWPGSRPSPMECAESITRCQPGIRTRSS